MPVAIVTASDSGIGKASAVALAERGFDRVTDAVGYAHRTM